MAIDIQRVDASLTADCLAFFARVDASLYRSGCYCTHFLHERGKPALAAQARAELRASIEAGTCSALVALAEGKAVGWCRAGALSALPRAGGGPYGRGMDMPDIGAIVCFAVAPEYRRRGIASRLLQSAVDLLREQGFVYAEAYPLVNPGNDARDYLGWLPMFNRAGFTTVSGVGDRFGGPRIAIVRKMLNPGAEWENNPLLPLRTKALYQISQAYEMVTGMATVRLGAINRDQPRKYRYNRRTLIDHWLTQAQAINNFAVVLGLISGAEYAAIIRRFQQTYPEVLEKLE